MELLRTARACLLAAALAAGAAAHADAATGIRVASFNFGLAQDSFQAFDPALGTLEAVSFDLSGDFMPLIISDGPTPGISEPLFITSSFSGFAGRGFSTLVASMIAGQVLSNVPGATSIAIAPFHDSFTFNAQSEATGFAADAYGGLFSAHLSDFLAGGPSGNEIDELPSITAFALSVTGATLPSVTTFVQGGGTVTYTYSFMSPPPAPEPAAWSVMLAGFALTGAAIRRRTAARRCSELR
jgi:hypothetical protein